MDEELLMASIIKDIDECKDKRGEILKKKMYLVDSPLRSSIEKLILTGYSFSESVIKAYEDYTHDLESKIKNVPIAQIIREKAKSLNRKERPSISHYQGAQR